MSQSETPELDPEMYPPMLEDDIRKIQKEPLDHTEELEAEGATVHEFGIKSEGDKWHNTSGRTKEEIREFSEVNEAGALTLKPCAHTNYIEFRLDPPSGASKECTCNSCWNKFWIAPFSQPGECPYCHERGFNIATKRVVNGE